MFSRLKDMSFQGKRVLFRADFNVPIQDGRITDDSRIRKALPTIRQIIDSGARQIIFISHLGRPEGDYAPEFSMKPVADRLSELLGEKIFFETNPRINNINSISSDKFVMLENLRFDKVEEQNSDEFAKKLAGFADVFVLDAFGAVHRAHASIVGVPKYLPSCAGRLLEKEIEMLKEQMDDPQRPFIAIIGGAKSDKADVIARLLEKVDMLIVGGVLANTFLKAKGIDIGASRYTEDFIDQAKKLLEAYHDKIALPVDYIIADRFSEDAQTKVAGINEDITGWMILDIGPYTISGYIDLIKKSKTVVWAGPIGVFEWENFRRGTWDIARTLAETDTTKIIGGGDSASAIKAFGLEDKMTHVSTGGGASLELLSGKTLPGIDVLEKNKKEFKKR